MLCAMDVGSAAGFMWRRSSAPSRSRSCSTLRSRSMRPPTATLIAPVSSEQITGDGIRLFGDADAGAVASSELSREKRIHRERKKAGGRGDAIFLHDHSTVVQRRAGAEDGRKQIVGKARIEGDSAFDVSAQADLTLDDDQGAGLMLGKEIRGENDVVVGITCRLTSPPRNVKRRPRSAST